MANPTVQVYHCGCEQCLAQAEHPEKRLHAQINLLMSRLNEAQRRWLAALLAEQIGLSSGGVRRVARICGISEKTVRRGLKELDNNFVDLPLERVRRAGAGRHNRM